MTKIYVIEGVRRGEPIWFAGGRWSNERPDAIEFKSRSGANRTLAAIDSYRAAVVEEDRDERGN